MTAVGAPDQASGLRLADLVAAFSLATDLGLGQPMEHVLRSWLIAVRLGERLGLAAEARVALYYVMALAWSGCVADSAEVGLRAGAGLAGQPGSRGGAQLAVKRLQGRDGACQTCSPG
jgi:hypothetical protein